jgi:hypothetical protein
MAWPFADALRLNAAGFVAPCLPTLTCAWPFAAQTKQTRPPTGAASNSHDG